MYANVSCHCLLRYVNKHVSTGRTKEYENTDVKAILPQQNWSEYNEADMLYVYTMTYVLGFCVKFMVHLTLNGQILQQ